MSLLKCLDIFLLMLLHVLTEGMEPDTVLTSVFFLHKYTHKSEIFLNLLLALVLPASLLDCLH